MKIGKKYHIGITIRFAQLTLAREKQEGHPQMLLKEDNKYITFDRAEEVLSELLHEGYECIPACDNTDKKGNCLGHN